MFQQCYWLMSRYLFSYFICNNQSMLEMESIGQSVESTATVALEDDANSSFTGCKGVGFRQYR